MTAAEPFVVTEPGLTPGSPEWIKRVSPSKVAAIIGVSPWDSQRSIWHKMRGDVPWDEETAAMERGTLCEPAVLNWWRKHTHHGEWAEQVTTTLADWCVATPDAIAEVDGGAYVIVEAKTASSDSNWGAPGTDEVPTYYLAQAYFAAHVLNLAGTPVRRIHMPVLFGTRLRFENYVIEYDEGIGSDLLVRCREFYDSLSCDTPPPLDDTTATYEAVRKVHKDIERGSEVELTEKQARDLVLWCDELKSTERSARLAKSTVIDAMGRTQYATHRGVRIARRQPRGEDVSFVVVAKPEHLPEKESAA